MARKFEMQVSMELGNKEPFNLIVHEGFSQLSIEELREMCRQLNLAVEWWEGYGAHYVNINKNIELGED